MPRYVKMIKTAVFVAIFLAIFTNYIPNLLVKMSSGSQERTPCVFCNIINKLESTEILYEDDDVCIFRDIKPAASYHLLTVPKRHIEHSKALTSGDKELVEKMVAVSKELIVKNNMSATDIRLGFHWPPFISVKHLHLHVIAPESEMGFISRTVFMKNSYWFVSVWSERGLGITLVFVYLSFIQDKGL